MPLVPRLADPSGQIAAIRPESKGNRTRKRIDGLGCGHFRQPHSGNKNGDAGGLARVCESSNVVEPGSSGSEADLLASLTELIGECEKRVAVT
ncbi:MAG: hypothetical protein ACE5FM_07825, partial [Methyloligellaceae bacterium]